MIESCHPYSYLGTHSGLRSIQTHALMDEYRLWVRARSSLSRTESFPSLERIACSANSRGSIAALSNKCSLASASSLPFANVARIKGVPDEIRLTHALSIEAKKARLDL